MRVFSSNCLVKTLEITDVINYGLTAALSFGYQDYYNKSLIMILGLARVSLCEMSRHR